jgi:hypothetical protein
MTREAIEDLQDRLALWEREKRLALRIGGVLTVVCIALAGHATIGTRHSQRIQTDELLLKDRDGLVRVRLMLDETDNPCLQFFDALGREQFALTGMPDTSAAMTFSDHGTRRAVLSTPSRGTARLDFPDQPKEAPASSTELLAEKPQDAELERSQPASWVQPTEMTRPRMEAAPSDTDPSARKHRPGMVYRLDGSAV